MMFSLNLNSIFNRNDDLESDLDQIRGSYEDKLQAVQTQLQMSASTLQQYHLVNIIIVDRIFECLLRMEYKNRTRKVVWRMGKGYQMAMDCTESRHLMLKEKMMPGMENLIPDYTSEIAIQ